MIVSLIPDVLAIVLAVVMSAVSSRAIVAYTQTRDPLFFLLGLALGLLALTALADFASSHLTAITLHTDWFLYSGQAVSFLFLFVSLLERPDGAYLRSRWRQRRLMRWHMLTSLAALVLLVLAPVLPAVPNGTVKPILSSVRCVFCFLILFRYIVLSMSKATRFTVMMASSFLLLSFGYLLILLQYGLPRPSLFDHLGDLLRIGGLLLLLVAFHA